MSDLSQATIDVIGERRRQQLSEGFSDSHDDKHNYGELADAAATYAMRPSFRRLEMSPYDQRKIWQSLWPWEVKWWKPKDRRRDLVRAGALIIAEIERLDRCKVSSQ
jgi:hypothetical protein